MDHKICCGLVIYLFNSLPLSYTHHHHQSSCSPIFSIPILPTIMLFFHFSFLPLHFFLLLYFTLLCLFFLSLFLRSTPHLLSLFSSKAFIAHFSFSVSSHSRRPLLFTSQARHNISSFLIPSFFLFLCLLSRFILFFI